MSHALWLPVLLVLRVLAPAPRVEVKEMLHGVEIADPYRWLEDRALPETAAFIESREARFRAAIDAIPQREAIARLLAPHFEREDVSIPMQGGSVLAFRRRAPGELLHSIVIQDIVSGRERVLVDPLAIDPAAGHDVAISALSDDGRRIAISIRKGGADETEICFLDTATGREVAERLPSARYFSVLLDATGARCWYTQHEDERSALKERRFGSPPPEDPVLFGSGVPRGSGVGASLSPDGEWLVASVWHGSAARRTEIHARRTAEAGPFRAIVNGGAGEDIEARFEPMPAPGGILFVRTNWNTPNGRILRIDLADPRREAWREVVPQAGHPMQDAALAGGRIVLRYLENVRPVLRVFTTDGALERTLEIPGGFGSMSNLSGEWGSDVAFLTSSSWVDASRIERVSVASGARTNWFEASARLPKGRFVIEQHWFESSDGARVPLFLGRRADAKADGSAPALMMGYGGFNLSQLPSFSPRVAAWLEMGGVVVLPSLRGGAEFGEEWHEQGMRARKQQTFDDLHAAADWLIREGWAHPKRMGLWGRSNGGLLVGAAITQRPELFRAVVCGYPLLDMLRYHQFLVARFWVPEYGSAEDAEQFGWLRAYSPYHNVHPGLPYPATLFVTGDADTRVAPLHARKMAALLESSTGSGHPVLLHHDTEMGHVGGLPADKELSDLADELSFLAWQLGVETPAPARKPRARLGR